MEETKVIYDKQTDYTELDASINYMIGLIEALVRNKPKISDPVAVLLKDGNNRLKEAYKNERTMGN